MNPNAAAFAMILKQRESQAQAGYGYGAQQGWPQPQYNQWTGTPQPPLPQNQPYTHQGYQPMMTSHASFAPPLPIGQPYPVQHSMGIRPPQPTAPYMAPQYPSFYSSVQQNVYQNQSYCAPAAQAPSYPLPPSQRSSANRFNQPKQKAAPPVEESGQYYCEPCDKEFTLMSAFETHKATHESCRHPGCQFSATKKVVMAHFHGAHGQFSGSGYKMIDVEGQKFRVLMGQSPEEIAQWRAERRKRFPSAATEEAKKRQQAELEAAGGLAPHQPTGKFGNKRERPERRRTEEGGDGGSEGQPSAKRVKGEDDGEGTDGEGQAEGDGAAETTGRRPAGTGTGKRRCIHWGRGRCKAGEACTFSHDFEPRQCEYFLRGRCKNGPKCYNVHDAKKRAEYRAANPVGTGRDSNGGGGDSEAGQRGPATGASSGSAKPERTLGKLNRNGELVIPAPLAGGARGTLWRKLLEDEINREENVVLQCLRYLVQSNFLDTTEAQSTAEAETLTLESESVDTSEPEPEPESEEAEPTPALVEA